MDESKSLPHITNRKRASIRRLSRDAVRRYYDMYNQELEVFFEVQRDDDADIRSSVVHSHSECQYIQREREGLGDGDGDGDDESPGPEETSQDDETLPEDEYEDSGTMWVAAEKRVFFRMLGRYSIHRVSEWRHMIPTKSLVEICDYFDVLRRNTEMLRQRRSKGLLLPRDLPIAYEMDETFVELEEYMSSKPLNKYAAESPEKGDKGEDAGEDALISLENWQKRWNSMYSHSGLEDLYPMSVQSLPVHPIAMQHLEELIRSHLRLLMWHTVLPVLPQRSIHRSSLLPKSQRQRKGKGKTKTRNSAVSAQTKLSHDSDIDVHFHGGKAEFTPAVISAEHVRRAVQALKHDRGPHSVATLAESIVATLRKFNVEYSPSTGNVFRHRHVRAGVVPAVLSAVEAAEQQPLSLVPRNTNTETDADADSDLDADTEEDADADAAEAEMRVTPRRQARQIREDDACDADDMLRSQTYGDAVWAFIMRDK